MDGEEPGAWKRVADQSAGPSMTSAHRPTFDHAKGKEKKVSSTITHKRALTSHSRLKFRTKKAKRNSEFYDGDDEQADAEGERRIPGITEAHVENLRRELEPGSGAKNDGKRDVVTEDEHEQDAGAESGSGRNESDSADVSGDDEEEEQEREEEEDDDEEALLREMELIKKEREEARRRLEEKEIEERAKFSNPLLRVEQEPDLQQQETPKKKSWRNVKSLSKKSNQSQSDRFSNDTLKSDFHKDFLDRYIR